MHWLQFDSDPFNMVVNKKNKKAQNNRRPQLIRYKDEIQIDQYLKNASAIPYKRMQHNPQKENPKKARKLDNGRGLE